MKYYTVEEAQARVPELVKLFALCREIREKAEARVAHLKTLQGGGAARQAEAAIERSQVEFLAGCLEQTLKGVEAMGAVLKGLDPALVDFPHRFEGGGEVYLCWREGEEAITHYHSLTEGFSGRKPLPQSAVRH